MRIVRYLDDGVARVGVRRDGKVFPLEVDTVGDLIREGADALIAAAGTAAESTDEGAITSRLLSPVERPGRMFFCGVNYADHVAEVPDRPYPTEPSIFAKAVVELTAPGDPIVLPKPGLGPDYEAELGIVIGRRTARVPAEQALDHVFGYTVVNDVSARSLQFGHGQLILGKGVDTFCPVGPELVTPDEIPDLRQLSIRTYVNGELRQNGNTADMIFPPEELIAFISDVVTLEPGDLISTGTPAGVGGFRDPPAYLEPGDEVSIEIDAIGRLTNPVVAGW